MDTKPNTLSEKKLGEIIRQLNDLVSMQDNPTQAVLFPYIAGIIDGEGTLRINEVKIKAHWNTSYHPLMSCGMTVREVPELLCKILGGSVREERVANVNWKSVWRWTLTGRLQIYSALKIIQPFLIVKREQAKVLISFCEGWVSPKRVYHMWVVDPEQLRWREDMYWKMRELNATGAGATTKRVGSREAEAIV
jgi:hypothetical protein